MNNRAYFITFRGISRRHRFIAYALISLLVLDSIVPTAAMAITGHDSMPEYRSFEPVATTNMVNLFSGQLTYNIPLLEVPGGYPINLSYHSSDVNNEALASWVGLGWNINPGAINRMKKGYPDEFRDKTITYHNRMPANWTVGINVGAGSELFSSQLLTLNAGYSIRYNNYNGLGTSTTGSFGVAGVLNLTASMNNGVYGFDAEVRPGNILNAVMAAMTSPKTDETTKEELQQKVENMKQLPDKNVYKAQELVEAGLLEAPPQDAKKASSTEKIASAIAGKNFTTRHGSNRSYPAASSPYTGAMVELQFDVGVNFLPPPIDLEGSIGGSFTIQKTNESSVDKQVYGYLHSDEAYTDTEAMMDYLTENENDFEKRDNVLGYPLPNNDLYSLSGEGMGGSFRAFRNDVGHYRKNEIVSEDFQVNAGADINLASIVTVPPMTSNLDYTAGADVGGSYHKSTTGAWIGEDAEYQDYMFNTEETFPLSGEKYYWRFSEDKAGYIDQSEEAALVNDMVPFRADLSGDDFEIDWNGSNYLDAPRRHENKRNKRSTYVLQHLNADFGETNQDGVKYKVYEKKTKLIDASTYSIGGSYILDYNHYSRDHEAPGEFITYSNDGSTYVYGLPVYARNEKQLQYGFPESDASGLGGTSADLIRMVTSSNSDTDYKRKIGVENDNEYVTAYLLTQILSSDYVDRTGNGPSSDDLGTFTKFNYYRVAGGNDWYSHRTPYQGVNFEQGSLSIDDDDMGSFTYGEKEVYYLHSVVSKTHAAIFTLGSRNDGKSAKLSDNPSPEDALEGGSASAMSLKKLVRIDLYSLQDCQKPSGLSEDLAIWEPQSDKAPLKTVHFDYSDGSDEYTLCKGLPNSTVADPDNDGKLTLRKVWFEHGGRIKAKISPYKFDYEYYVPVTGDPYDNALYGSLEAEAAAYGTLSGQNPDYNVANTDRWGNYRDYTTMSCTAATEHCLGNLARFWPFVHQNPDPAAFDPAAHCLKRIELPSGGEIHIQYEQADYAYVQDKKAMMMVPLLPSSSGVDATEPEESGSGAEDKKYYLDLAKMGIDYADLYTNPADVAPLAHGLFEPMVKNGDRIYFNFLYAIIGDDPDYTQTNSDYIEGFARINGYGYDDEGIFFAFKGCEGTSCANNASFPAEMFTTINYQGGETSRREFPNKVCKEFYKSQRRLKIDGGASATSLEDAVVNNDAEAVGQAFVNIMERILDPLEGKCKYMDPAMSFVRVQVPQGEYRYIDGNTKYYSKLGGGVRVKRLISFDAGMDAAYSGDHKGAIYGNEYIYTTLTNPKDPNSVISSGVATNEPAGGRRESALVNPIDKNAQSKVNAIFYGRDMYSLEGPLGESVLPGPSVGYSRVEVKPIYQASNGLGSEVHEFYTVRDYPFESRRTIVEQTRTTPVSASIGFSGVSISYEREAPNLAQGYHFINHSMHGKQKSVKKCGPNMQGSPYYMELYEYFEPDENVSVMGDDMIVTTVPMRKLGQETEMLFESRRVYDWGVSAKIGGDVTGGVFTIPIAPFVIPFFYPASVTLGGGANEAIFDSHVTTTITTYPALLKRTVRVQEGIAHYTENMIMDDHSGDPTVVRSYDDFYHTDAALTASQNAGIYINQQFRGSWKYDNLKSRFYNEDLVVNGSITYSSTGSGTNYKEYLKFNSSSASSCSELQNFVRGDYIKLLHSGSAVWLYHVDEVDFANNRLYIRRSQFSDGVPTGTITGVHVIKSGYTNRLGENVGSIVLFNRGSNPAIVQGVDNLDANHPLVQELNSSSSLQNLSPGNSTNVNLSIDPGDPDYQNLNLSAYSDAILNACGEADPANLEVTDVSIDAEYTAGGELILTITSFTFNCSDGPVIINCPEA